MNNVALESPTVSIRMETQTQRIPELSSIEVQHKLGSGNYGDGILDEIKYDMIIH